MTQRETPTMGTEINLFPLFKALLKKAWLMCLVGLVIAFAAFLAAKMLIAPTYRSGFTAYVNNQQLQTTKDYLTSSDVSASKDLVRTYNSILKSSAILTSSAKYIDLDYSYAKLKGMIKTEIQSDTEIISVYVVSTDPKIAYDLASAISMNAPKTMADIVEGSSMKIIDYPEYSDAQYGPNYYKYALMGFAMGVLIILIKCVIDYVRNDNIQSEQELENRFQIPLLGVIPDVEALSASNDDYAYSYAYRAGKNDRSDKQNEKK